MNRRGFLGSLAALCVALLLPKPKPVVIHIPEHETWIFASQEWDGDSDARTLTCKGDATQLRYPWPERVPCLSLHPLLPVTMT